MADVNLTGFPDDLLNQLRQRATANHRDVTAELVDVARESLSQHLTADEKLAIAADARRLYPDARLAPEILVRICNGGVA